jgi:adenosylmethionine-8-amino-7-oxononanoate aminotransferase
MASLKESLTKIFLTQSGREADDETVKKMLFTWWKNPRQKVDTGLTLTEDGYEFLTDTLKLKSYAIPFPKDFEFTTQVILYMDRYLDCPHYYTKKKIVVFKEKKACELLLFSGDIRKYGLAKAMARQRELNSI